MNHNLAPNETAPRTLYLLVNREKATTDACALSLQAACERKGLACKLLIVEDIVLDSAGTLAVEPNSLLYRVSTTRKAATLEYMLVLSHPGVFTTIYTPKTSLLPGRAFQELYEQIVTGLPVVPTYMLDETWQSLDAAALTQKAASLGGFPVLFKTLGKSHGQGVSRVETAEELQALLQTKDLTVDNAIVRKYLADYRHYRLVVVDGAVVAAIEYHQPADDFRTNVGKVTVTPLDLTELPEPTKRIATDGVAIRRSLLGGVDVLVDQTDNTPYVAEVNVPCNFSRAEAPTGVDISSKIIDAMIQQAGR